MQDLNEAAHYVPRRDPWNKGKLTGPKSPLRPKTRPHGGAARQDGAAKQRGDAKVASCPRLFSLDHRGPSNDWSDAVSDGGSVSSRTSRIAASSCCWVMMIS
jgi:hypothetical protein